MFAPHNSKRKRISALKILVMVSVLLNASVVVGNLPVIAGGDPGETDRFQDEPDSSLNQILAAESLFEINGQASNSINQDNCTDFDLKYDYSLETYEISAPNGKAIMRITIKSRTGCDQFDADVEKGCYTIDGIGSAFVRVSRTETGSSCKEISHLEVNFSRSEGDSFQVCHYDKNEGYTLLTLESESTLEEHDRHPDDFSPAPTGGCPVEETPQTMQLCHFDQDSGYELLTVKVDAQLGGHAEHGEDIFPIPPNGCPGKEKVTPLCHATGSSVIPFINLPSDEDGIFSNHNLGSNDLIPAPAEGCPAPQPPESICVDFLLFHTFRDGDLEIYRLDGIENKENYHLINLSQGPNSEDSRPTRSWDDSWVVFESNRDGNIELYISSTRGGTPARLTVTKSNNLNPMFLADNHHVAYQSDRNGNWDIYLLDISTGEETQLTTGLADDSNPYVSPDNDWITFQSDRSGNWDIYLLSLATGEEIQITNQDADQFYPTWSPNGKYIAFLSNSAIFNDLWIYNIQTGEYILVGTGGNYDANNHSWSPGGEKLAYQSMRNDNLDIFSYDIFADEEYQLTNFSGIDASPTWDCSGTEVTFNSARDGNLNIFYVFWKGGTQQNLTSHPATDKWPAWSPAKEQASRGN